MLAAPAKESTEPSKIGLLCVSTHGSLGDEALLRGVIEGIRSISDTPIVLLNNYGDSANKYAELLHDYEHLEYVTLSPRYRGLKALWEIRRMAASLKCLLIPGADVLDGAYNVEWSLFKIRLSDIALRAGIPAGLLGFSYNEKPANQCSKSIARLHPNAYLSNRDAVSQNRVLHFTGKSSALTADLAFLMSPRVPSQCALELRKRLEPSLANKAAFLGICPNALFLKFGWTMDQIVVHFSQLVMRLLEQNQELQIVLISHDFRKHPTIGSDLDLCKNIYTVLPRPLQNKVILIDRPLDAPGVKWICSKMDFIFTTRMHCAVAALGTGVPASAIEYQGKFQGLYAHFELPELLFNKTIALDPYKTADQLSSQLARHTELKVKIQQRLPGVIELARSNLSIVPQNEPIPPNTPGERRPLQT